MPQQVIKRAPVGSLSFTLPGAPVPAPRQTRSDKWNPRPEVLRYRAWSTELHHAAPLDWLAPLSDTGIVLSATFYMPLPASWPQWKHRLMLGQPHLQKPDTDNLVKALSDALWPSCDSMVFRLRECVKFWDDGQGPRVIVSVEFVPLNLPRLGRKQRESGAVV
jgi:Holliday junction resolvase RusA-like endonuclease